MVFPHQYGAGAGGGAQYGAGGGGVGVGAGGPRLHFVPANFPHQSLPLHPYLVSWLHIPMFALLGVCLLAHLCVGSLFR